MIDTSRTFHEVSALKKLVESMAMAKLNVLHLHLTDGDSFPLKIRDLSDP